MRNYNKLPSQSCIQKIGGALFSVVLALMITVPANAQETEEPPELINDRPDQTESSTIIPAGSVQAEVGVTIDNEKKGGIKSSALTIPAGLFRYGVSNSFELRLIVEYQSATETPDGGEGVTQSGINDIALGGKFKLFEENGFLPDAALNLHLHLPRGQHHRPSESRRAGLPVFVITYPVGYV